MHGNPLRKGEEYKNLNVPSWNYLATEGMEKISARFSRHLNQNPGLSFDLTESINFVQNIWLKNVDCCFIHISDAKENRPIRPGPK